MQKETALKDAEQELKTLRAAREELSLNLAVEKAKMLSLGESLTTEKAASFDAGVREGSSKIVEEYSHPPSIRGGRRRWLRKRSGTSWPLRSLAA